jgi:hypothetical protein
MREHTFQLLFAAFAAGLCIFERHNAGRVKNAEVRPVTADNTATTKSDTRTSI